MNHTEPPDLPESWSWPWSTEDPLEYPYQDYDSLMCERSSVGALRARVEPPLFWITAALGLSGNILVLWVYLPRGRGLKVLTHLFLLQLCFADMLFLLILPLWAEQGTAGWSYGPAACKITHCFYKINLFSVSLFLACIAVDRYVVIVHPTAALNGQKRRRGVACAVSVAVWVLALALAAPELAFATTALQEDHVTCRMVYPAHWGPIAKATTLGLQVSVGFFVPLVVMVICYAVIGRRLLLTRSFHRQRPLLVVAAIMVAFVVTQLPHTCVLIAEMVDSQWSVLDCPARLGLDQSGLVLRALAYVHPALNPFLYALIGRRFRQELTSLLQRKRRDLLSKTPPPVRVRTWTGSGTKSRTLSDSETSQGLSL